MHKKRSQGKLGVKYAGMYECIRNHHEEFLPRVPLFTVSQPPLGAWVRHLNIGGGANGEGREWLVLNPKRQ